jgi:hypothetical protein
MIFQHQPYEHLNKSIQTKHAQNRINPLDRKVVFRQLPVSDEGDLLTVDESGGVGAVEEDAFWVQILCQTLEQFPHSF